MIKKAGKNGRLPTKNGVKGKIHAANGKSHPPAAPAVATSTNISKYLIDRLYGLGLRKMFGVPGDYVLNFYEELCNSPIEVIGTTREDCAGYAADAYARVSGLGALCVTYCVGGLSVANSVAGAYAEKSPLVVITGAPGLEERRQTALLHHKVRDFNTQREVFEKITVASANLDDPLTAFRDIDRVLDAVMRYKRPGYIEIPRDMAHITPLYNHTITMPVYKSDPKQLAEAVEETAAMLAKAKKPVLLAGVEVHRFGLQDLVVKFAEKNNIGMCSTLLGKSVVSERHPLYVGVYEGAMGREIPRQFIEEADCVLMLGTFMTDINLGVLSANLDPAKCICATSEDLQLKYHHFSQVLLTDFIQNLFDRDLTVAKRKLPPPDADRLKPYTAVPNAKVTVRRLFQKINTILNENMVVICDVGDSLFAGADLVMSRRTEFLSPAYYLSMGFAVPAALGAQLADPKSRPIVLVGDGAFQMTGMELSTICRQKLNPIILVLNNKGYSTERFIKDGKFNDIGNWNYHKIPEVIGGGWGFEVNSETDLDKALDAALANRDSFSLLNIHLDPYDRSDALERLCSRLAQKLGEAKHETKPDVGNSGKTKSS